MSLHQSPSEQASTSNNSGCRPGLFLTRSLSPKPVRVLEFIGIPASGKTSLFQALRRIAPEAERSLLGPDYLNTLDPRSYSLGHLKWRPVPELLASAILSPTLHSLLIAHAIQASGLSLEILTQLSRCSRLARALSYVERELRGPEALILDQGLVQYLGSMTVPSEKVSLPVSRSAMLALVENRIGGWVHIRCDVDTSVERLSSRKNGRSRFDPGNGWQVARSARKLGRDDLIRMGRFLDQSASILEESGYPVLQLSAATSPDANAVALLKWMRRNSFYS
ncbi:hypothetical protein DC522_28700 [Microvirga sp. KLBC 81]|nr:hypothetical protein DC522_28700 [Microvirga sp. KLBC 81]